MWADRITQPDGGGVMVRVWRRVRVPISMSSLPRSQGEQMAAPFMLPSSVQQAAGVALVVVQKVHADSSFQNVEVVDVQRNDLNIMSKRSRSYLLQPLAIAWCPSEADTTGK